MSSSQIAVFGGGCFWCTEAVFLRLKGILKVTSGYAGGHVQSPNYEHVSSGATGHAEVIQIEFNPDEISYRDLLDVFFHTHDPTTLNRQGNDSGTQYRSVIFTTSPEQEKEARDVMQELRTQNVFSNEIVTEVLPLDMFYSAEEYHQNYYDSNQSQPYCQIIISPKLKKFEEKFAHLLKN